MTTEEINENTAAYRLIFLAASLLWLLACQKQVSESASPPPFEQVGSSTDDTVVDDFPVGEYGSDAAEDFGIFAGTPIEAALLTANRDIRVVHFEITRDGNCAIWVSSYDTEQVVESWRGTCTVSSGDSVGMFDLQVELEPPHGTMVWSVERWTDDEPAFLLVDGSLLLEPRERSLWGAESWNRLPAP